MSDLKLNAAVLHIVHDLNLSNLRPVSVFAYFLVALDNKITLEHRCKYFQTDLYISLISFDHTLKIS